MAGKAKKKAVAPNPRNQHRGTPLSQFRFGPVTLAELEQLVARRTRAAGGAPISRADAVRAAITYLNSEEIKAGNIVITCEKEKLPEKK